MSHFRGIRAQRMTAPRNSFVDWLLEPEPAPQDFADTEQSDEIPELAGWDWPMPDPYHGDTYHQMPGLPSHPRGGKS